MKNCLKFFVFFILITGFFIHHPTSAQSVAEGDLVRTKDNPALYLIQNSQRRVFPHLTIYLSWGLPSDFFTVKIVG